jgi:hypothetical protein
MDEVNGYDNESRDFRSYKQELGVTSPKASKKASKRCTAG